MNAIPHLQELVKIAELNQRVIDSIKELLINASCDEFQQDVAQAKPTPPQPAKVPSTEDARKALIDFGKTHGATRLREIFANQGWKSLADAEPSDVINALKEAA